MTLHPQDSRTVTPQPTNAKLRCGAPSMIYVWHGPGGWGELKFYLDEDGDWHCDSETLGREFVKATFAKWLETVVFDGEPPKDADV